MRYDPYYEEIKGELLFEHVEVISKPSLKKIKSHQSIDIHELIDVTENF
jgi:hypothetical protein